MNFLKEPVITDKETIKALISREINIERTINKFRILFVVLISIFDTIALFKLASVGFQSNLISTIITFFFLSIPLVTLIHFLSKNEKNIKIIRYLSITFDLGITFFYGFSMIIIEDFPLPISKLTFAVLISICLIFFNSLSVLRTRKRIIIYSGILSLFFNAILYIFISLYVINMFSMVVVFTSIMIVIMSLFNLWVSEHIINFFLVNNKLDNANKEIAEANEELNQQNEEITAQRDEIEKQKEIVENINHEISQSIDYATRLQQSILPDKKLLTKYLSDYFVFFIPKDKVSGDFYWWSHIENHTVITAADCTGHGVPGAFMSMLGASFLREIVEKEYVTHTGVILRKLRKEIIKALKQKGKQGEQKDGMDMAIISIDHESKVIQFSGANNPIYIVTNKNKLHESESLKLFEYEEGSEFKLFEIKPDKMPIAIYEKMDSFATHEIKLSKGDMIYLFSDGFADQFGGDNNKKFKYKPFKRMILENADKPMSEQNVIMEETFTHWIKDYEQVDDVTVLGIMI